MVASDEQGLQTTPPTVQTVVVCGDNVCAPGEPVVKNSPSTSLTCGQDCPIVLGSCDAPGGNDVGDSTVPCGGYGTCNLAALTCNCFVGYAGDACGYCAEGYVRNQNKCDVVVSAVLAVSDPPAPPAANTPNPNRVRNLCARK
jgi:hypothetical protein